MGVAALTVFDSVEASLQHICRPYFDSSLVGGLCTHTEERRKGREGTFDLHFRQGDTWQGEGSVLLVTASLYSLQSSAACWQRKNMSTNYLKTNNWNIAQGNRKISFNTPVLKFRSSWIRIRSDRHSFSLSMDTLVLIMSSRWAKIIQTTRVCPTIT